VIGILDVHMSTIYRFLDELEELGVVSHSHLGHGRAVYDLSPVGHSHLVCELCGAVTETPNELFAAFASSVKARYGFSIDPHHFAMAGRCRNCVV
jgi:Fur family ferric uptake transcriptional regulator